MHLVFHAPQCGFVTPKDRPAPVKCKILLIEFDLVAISHKRIVVRMGSKEL